MIGARVLVVEDSEDVAELVRTHLEFEGMAVSVALTGEAAQQLLTRELPDALVLDLRLPDVDGLTLCREIRRSSSLPILILSARNEDMDKIVGLEVGADDYLAKPFNPRELVARVKALLRRAAMLAKPQAETVLLRKGLRIDLSAHRVEYQGAPVLLTPVEFSLLRVLAGRPGQVYSRQQLLDEVWGDSFVANERTVDTHIGHLRTKLREVAPIQFISSVRAVGYRFEP